jgi:ABC-2 type transport system ATP-binding protein
MKRTMDNEKKPPLIQVRNLQKHFKVFKHHRGPWGALRNLISREYKIVRAVDGIHFEIQTGELVGYLGPNGAGKSTTIKMLSGLLVPTGGDLVVSGRIPWKQRREHVANIGTVFGQRTTLWWDLPVVESLNLLKYIYKIEDKRFQQNIAEFKEILDLDTILDIPVRSLSLGQRMRADLCAALLHDPPVVFLDEPTIGLDVVAKERIRQFIQHINNQRKTTIILTTHDVSDVAKLCKRVMIIDQGHLIYDGPLETLQDRFGEYRELVVDFAQFYEDYSVEGARVSHNDKLRVTYQFRRNEVTASQLINRISSKFRIQDLSVREPEIEATIRRIYEEGLLRPGNETKDR